MNIIKPFIIAEIGINHNGDIGIAKKLIDMAKKCGCDAVKFQKRTIELVYSKEMLEQYRESPWGETQRAQKEGLEFGERDYDEIDEYCKKIGIVWFASAWDIPSQKFLRNYNCKYNKVASAMLTKLDLVEEIASEKKMTFVSTGMSTYDNIDAAIETFKKHNCPLTLMHTLSTYPSKEEDLNLLMIRTLREKYALPVGYSGHEASVSPSILAAALGAVAIERHITLDRAMYGSDQSASLEMQGLDNLVNVLNKLPLILGDGHKVFSDDEQKVAEKLRYWEND